MPLPPPGPTPWGHRAVAGPHDFVWAVTPPGEPCFQRYPGTAAHCLPLASLRKERHGNTRPRENTRAPRPNTGARWASPECLPACLPATPRAHGDPQPRRPPVPPSKGKTRTLPAPPPWPHAAAEPHRPSARPPCLEPPPPLTPRRRAAAKTNGGGSTRRNRRIAQGAVGVAWPARQSAFGQRRTMRERSRRSAGSPRSHCPPSGNGGAGGPGSLTLLGHGLLGRQSAGVLPGRVGRRSEPALQQRQVWPECGGVGNGSGFSDVSNKLFWTSAAAH